MKSPVQRWVRSTGGRILQPLRNGQRAIMWTPEHKMGLGNHLYLWLWAHMRRRAGFNQDGVLIRPSMEQWLAHFPSVSDLVVRPNEVRWRDQRLVDEYHQHFTKDYTESDLSGFVRERILTAPGFALLEPVDPDRVVVNVRRGDYYSNPALRGLYAFDLVEYLGVAVERTATRGNVSEFHVVSDGLDWCRARLGWLADCADRLTFADAAASAMNNFAAVATARRVILTNSTFAYWGGYVSNALYGDNQADVAVPRFHHRGLANGAAFQLNPRWNIIEDIPGGWES